MRDLFVGQAEGRWLSFGQESGGRSREGGGGVSHVPSEQIFGSATLIVEFYRCGVEIDCMINCVIKCLNKGNGSITRQNRCKKSAVKEWHAGFRSRVKTCSVSP